MNRVHTVLAVTVVTAAIVGWQLWSRIPIEMGEQSEPTPHPSITHPARSTPDGTSVQAPTPPDTTSEITELSAAQQLEQFGCTVSDQYFNEETSEYRDIYSCPPGEPDLNPEQPHPYESWSNETLAHLAYGDPKAAEILGLRHITSAQREEEALGLSLLYRSAALSGDPEVFRKAIGQRYAYLSINGEPQLHNLRQLLVFNVIGKRLGGKRFDPIPVEAVLLSANRPADEIQQLRQAADQILRSMAQVQSEVTGNTSIAEAIADA